MADIALLLTVAGSSAAATAWISTQLARNAKASQKKVDAVQTKVDAVQNDLTAFKTGWPAQLNGTYRRAPECALIHEALARQLAQLPAVLAASEEFRRIVRHETRGAVQQAVAAFELAQQGR